MRVRVRAHAVQARQIHCCLTGSHARSGSGNQRILLRELRVEIFDFRPCGPRIGLRLIQGRAEVPVVDARNHLPGVHRLVVLDQNGRNVARDTGGDQS
jgi:hypothetical protein